MAPVRKVRCSLCHPARCTCDAKTAALEKEANRWASRERGEKLPSERDTGRLLGDSFVTADQLQALEGKRENAREMREYLAMLEGRLRALDHQTHANAAERRRVAVQVEILRMRYEGDGLDETAIARAFGRRSHSWASEQLATIYADARARLREVGSVAVTCARPGCGHVITRLATTGRPAKYHSEKCQRADTERRRRLRLAAARARGGNRGGKSADRGEVRVSSAAVVPRISGFLPQGPGP
ncbi:MAG TPA: hypothetical protein VHF22_14430 [Planctomycetota bacterium]|nr:hypothetical protein [Planctomycetota bacterium]